MASSPLYRLLPMLLLSLAYSPSTTLSQGPTVSQCGSRLLPLAPCAPFVQGTVPSPAQPCCQNLQQLYNQEPGCLCLLLNRTTLASFPINRTLALQLPGICSLQIDSSSCSGVASAPTSPASQVSFGSRTNSTVAASPVITVTPQTGIIGFGLHQISSGKSNLEVRSTSVARAATIFLSTSLMSSVWA